MTIQLVNFTNMSTSGWYSKYSHFNKFILTPAHIPLICTIPSPPLLWSTLGQLLFLNVLYKVLLTSKKRGVTKETISVLKVLSVARLNHGFASPQQSASLQDALGMLQDKDNVFKDKKFLLIHPTADGLSVLIEPLSVVLCLTWCKNNWFSWGQCRRRVSLLFYNSSTSVFTYSHHNSCNHNHVNRNHNQKALLSKNVSILREEQL